MERVKKIEEGIIRPDALLVKIVEKKAKTNLILPESVKDNDEFVDYIEVVAVGNKVEDFEKGDIILDVGGEIQSFLLGEERYAFIYRNYILYGVKASNFDKEKAVDTEGNLEV